MQEYVQGSQHQGNRTEQLNQDVERRTGSILHGIADGIADHTGLMRVALLPQDGALEIETINHLTCFIHTQVTGFNVLLRIVHCATAVVQEQGEHDTAHGTDHQHTGLGLGAKDDADGDGRKHGNYAREYHSS